MKDRFPNAIRQALDGSMNAFVADEQECTVNFFPGRAIRVCKGDVVLGYVLEYPKIGYGFGQTKFGTILSDVAIEFIASLVDEANTRGFNAAVSWAERMAA